MINRLQNPLFIISVLLLLLNDFFLKQYYGNTFTGKLSDFTGLFALPFFLSCLLPKYSKYIHILTAMGFIWWKSELSQPFIDSISLSGFRFDRVVDFSDTIALTSIVMSYLVFSRNYNYKKINRAFLYTIIPVSSFAFMATSVAHIPMAGYATVDKEYPFDLPMDELVSRYNDLQKKELDKLKDTSLYTYEDESGVYYIRGTKDTLAYVVNAGGANTSDTIKVKNYLSEFYIYNDSDSSSVIRLTKIIGNMRLFRSYGKAEDFQNSIHQPVDPIAEKKKEEVVTEDESEKERIIKEFEKRIIKKLK